VVPSRPTFARVDLWAEREAQVLLVTLRGLKALAEEPPPADDEDSLNWALASHIRQAVLAGRRSGEVSLEPPVLEPRSMTVAPVSAGPAMRDRKRPDLVWSWCDDQASVGESPFLEMVIECKRLGTGELCRLYVAQGIVRFQNEEHAYAKLMRSAFMVGYLRGITAEDAARRVGRVLESERLAPLTNATRPGASFGQRLRRPYPVDPFDLHHLWQTVP
jgi:hypothetical protein